MEVLVTGGAGFLGSHLVDRLVDQGHEVWVLDNCYTGRWENLSQRKAVHWIHADVSAPDLSTYRLQGFERIFHLACPASPPHYQRDPVFTLDTGYIGTRNMLELAKRSGARILFASTSEVYGDPDNASVPTPETYWGHVNPYGERSMYDESKRVGEALCWAYQHQHGVDARIVRIFNTYGPRMAVDDGRAVSNFCVQALKGEPLTVYGSGRQTRSLCYVSDTVDGMVRLMEAPENPGPVNVGNPHEITLAELAGTIAGLAMSRADFSLKPLPSDDPRRRCPDISKAKRVLGWEPKVKLKDGLRATLEWFRKELAR